MTNERLRPTMGMVQDRVAIVTGGAGELGAHMCRLLSDEGARIVVNDVNEAAATALADEICAAGGDAEADGSDVSTFEGGAATVEHAVGSYGKVDILVLLAGRMTMKPLVEITEEDWDGVTTSHLKGAFSVLRAAAPTMIEQGYGRVVLASSVHGTIGDANMSPYCAAKAGIVGLMRAAAIELDCHGICVNAICPAGKDGEFGPVSARLAGPAAPNASLVTYLASEEAGWLTGHVFDTSGSGRIGLYPPLVPHRLNEQRGGYSVDELRDVIPRMFEPTYTMDPRQRPRVVAPVSGGDDGPLSAALSPLFHEMLASRGLIEPPPQLPRTPWR